MIMNEEKNEEAFSYGFYIWFLIQFMVIITRFIGMFSFSWWLVFIPTYLVMLGGFFFAAYFWFTCNPRIEKDKNDVDNAD